MKKFYFVSFSYTKWFFMQKFGTMSIDFSDVPEVNSYGHIIGMVNILKEKGYKKPVVINFIPLN